MRQLAGLYVRFTNRLDALENARIQALSERLMANLLPGITDVYPGYINLFLEFDVLVVSRGTVRAWVRTHLKNLQPKPSGREIEIPVRYNGEDLQWVAQQTGHSASEVIRLHATQTYRVFATGFVPGQPFMGVLHDALQLPRRPTPRARVEGGSVAIANAQTSIYPLPTPGGWHVLGAALEHVYDPNRTNPFLLAPGDVVRFRPSQGIPPPAPQTLETLPSEPHLPTLRVEKPGLLDVVVDDGRVLAAHFGMAFSGALDARSAHAANAMVGNPSTTPLLEMTLTGPILTVLRDVVLGFAGFGMAMHVGGKAQTTSVLVRVGQRVSFVPTMHGARGYLALAGGFEAATFLGSCSTDLRGLVGRKLQAGDVLGAAQTRVVRPGFAARTWTLANSETILVRLLAGPQATPDALEALSEGVFAVVSCDRMGLRLHGNPIPGGELVSEATPMGAVQVTTNGDPIVLLNDRGRIGGYTKPAVVDARDLPLLAQVRPGQKLRFLVANRNANTRHWFLDV